MSRIQAHRYHDISCGHRVVGHESKCAHLHGHNYRIHFTLESKRRLDGVGRVLDFSEIKSKLCMWIENAWDHKMLIYQKDPWIDILHSLDAYGIFVAPFNPTAENMAEYLLEHVGPSLFRDSDCTLTAVTVEETRKCSASARI